MFASGFSGEVDAASELRIFCPGPLGSRPTEVQMVVPYLFVPVGDFVPKTGVPNSQHVHRPNSTVNPRRIRAVVPWIKGFGP